MEPQDGAVSFSATVVNKQVNNSPRASSRVQEILWDKPTVNRSNMRQQRSTTNKKKTKPKIDKGDGQLFVELVESIANQLARLENPDWSSLSFEFSELSLLCSRLTSVSSPDLSDLDDDALRSIVDYLHSRVDAAAAVTILSDAAQFMQSDTVKECHTISVVFSKWMFSGSGASALETLKQGLDAGILILGIMILRRGCVNEDALEAVIMLFRSMITQHLLPTINQTAHILHNPEKQSEKDKTIAMPPSKRRRLSEGGIINNVLKEYSKVYGCIMGMCDSFSLLTEYIEKVIKAVALEDRQILMLTSGALNTLELEHGLAKNEKERTEIRNLQQSCIFIVAAAFRRYPSHRDSVLEDLFPLMLKMPANKRSMRNCKISYTSALSPVLLRRLNDKILRSVGLGESRHIQMLTFLLVSITQACVKRPLFSEPSSPDDAKQFSIVSGLGSCHAVCQSFMTHLVHRCLRNKDGAAEYRPVLVNLVEDLLCILVIPEYPAAEILLSALFRTLHSVLQQVCKPSQNSNGPDGSFVTVIFDLLGKLCAVQAKIYAIQREKPVKVGTDVPRPVEEDVMHVECHCGQDRQDVFLVNCDHCHVYSHGSCVGIGHECVPEEWYCDSCQLGKIYNRQKQRWTGDAASDVKISDIHVIRYAFLSTLVQRLSTTGVCVPTKIHLARWIDYTDQESTKSDDDVSVQSRIQSDLLSLWDEQKLRGETLTEEGETRVLLTVIVKSSPLLRSFRQQLSFIVSFLGAESMSSLRKLSLKCVEKIVEGDPELMLAQALTKAVARRLSDENISVREAAVSLVGAYVVRYPEVANVFHSSLLGCMSDVGISVRKRTVRIFQEVLLSNPQYKNRASIFESMLYRAIDRDEEDTICELIDEVFMQLWFREMEMPIVTKAVIRTPIPVTSSGRDDMATKNSQSSSVPSVVTPLSSTTSDQSIQHSYTKKSDFAALQMVEVMRDSRNESSLGGLFNRLMMGTSSPVKSRRSSNSKALFNPGQCRILVKSLFELLVSVEESGSTDRTRMGKDITATLRTIQVLAMIAPLPIIDHIDTLLPYFKADNGVDKNDETIIVGLLCRILSTISPHFSERRIRSMSAGSIVKDLEKIIYSFHGDTLVYSVEAFAKIGACQHNKVGSSHIYDSLLKVSKRFYTYLIQKDSVNDFTLIDIKIKSNVYRALKVLGLICEHMSLVGSDMWNEDDVCLDNAANNGEKLSWENFVPSCYFTFLSYLKKEDADTKSRGLSALGGLFVQQPRLMLQLEQAGFIGTLMAEDSPIILQLESILCWRRMLLAEERRLSHVTKDEQYIEDDDDVEVTPTNISGDQNGDATLFGGVLTSHCDRIFKLMLSPHSQIRVVAIELIEVILRQGLVNPNEAIPYLLALQGDNDVVGVREVALKLLLREGERRPQLLRQRICEGMKQAYTFQKETSKTNDVSSLLVARKGKEKLYSSVFDRVFLECIANNRKYREGFFKSVLAFFDVKAGSSKSLCCDPGLLAYASQTLAHLSYSTVTDPLFIICKVRSIITIRGTQLLDDFLPLVRSIMGSDWDDVDYLGSDDALDTASKDDEPHLNEDISFVMDKKFDLKRFEKLCQGAIGFCLLSQLKLFLQQKYHLSESRCLMFEQNEKCKIVEKGALKSFTNDAFEPKMYNWDATKALPSKVDLMIKQYGLFRSTMRLELMSDNNSMEDDDNDDDDDNNNHEDVEE